MILRYVEGDIFPHVAKKDTEYDVFLHGCNCFNTMGKGIAPQVAAIFPSAEKADKRTVKGDIHKLGNYSRAKIASNGLEVINAYLQYDFAKVAGKGGRFVEYTAIREVFTKMNELYAGKRMAIPKIGAGLAGGNWELIAHIIDSVTPDLDITVFVK